MLDMHGCRACGKDTQVKLDDKVILYQLGDFQNQKPGSNPSQKKSDKDKWV